MTTDIRAALERLVELDDSSPMQGGQWATEHENAIADAIEALAAEPAGEVPSAAELTQFLFDNFRGPIEFICEAEEEAHVMIRNHIKFAHAAFDRWARPAAPPAPKPGEVGELVAWLQSMRELAGEHNPEEQRRYDRAATLLSQSSAPAPAMVPVAVEALTRLYWWGGMSGAYGYSADVVLGVRDWIDGGMVGGLPPLPAWVADRCPPLLQGGERES